MPMKILNPSQLKQVDEQTIANQAINSWDLMQRASATVVASLLDDFPELLEKPVYILCGKGNNGGDGLAIAGLLKALGATVEVYLIDAERYSADNAENQEKLGHERIRMFNLEDILAFERDAIILDCLFGFGLNTALSSEWRGIIDQINAARAVRISVDMPSGLSCETHITVDSPIIRADRVYTFQVPKLNLLLPEYGEFAKSFSILDIGLDTEAMEGQETNMHYLTAKSVKSLVPIRSKFSHKGTFGHALLIGGSYGKMGAMLLASKAALRTGCGLVSVGIPNCGTSIVQTAFPEAMVFADAAELSLRDFNFPTDLTAIGMGVGMGTDELTVRGFAIYLQSLPENAKLILDADALNILAQQVSLLQALPAETILSPHPKELSRLIGTWDNDYEKLSKAKIFASEHQVFLIIKGANSVLVCPDESLYFNSTGNPGMATGGSGDVLTGILTSLRAQGMSAKDTAILGMYLHGLAGDIASRETGEASLIASDIINNLANAFQDLMDS